MKKRKPREVDCPSCGAVGAEACKVTLSERPEPLSIHWEHRTRTEARDA